MVPSRGATDGMSIHAPSSPTIDSPVASPATATPSGITAASTARNVTNRMISAAMMPIISAGPVERSFSTVGSSPPNSTCTPAASAGPAVSSSASSVAPTELGGRARRTAPHANAVVPSGEIDRGLASGSVTPTTWSSDRTSSIVAAIAPAARGSVTAPSGTWNTTIAVAPARSGNRSSSRSIACCDSTPGHLEVVDRSAAGDPVRQPRDRSRTANHTSTTRRRCTPPNDPIGRARSTWPHLHAKDHNTAVTANMQCSTFW